MKTETKTELLTAQEASDFLRLAKSTLAKLRCIGGSPAYIQLGRRIAYRRVDLEAWLAKRVAKNTADADARLPRRLTEGL